MHIALNAHLLSSEPGYRSAGIHGYIDGVLRHLHAAADEPWQFTAFVGAKNQRVYDGITLQRARFDTESPIRRIAWEQAVQPIALARGGFDLAHGMAFISPLISPAIPSVVTVYDLSFIHYPERLSAARRLYLRWLTPLSIRRAQRVIAISHSTADDLVATLNVPRDQIIVAAPGYDPARFSPASADKIAAFRRANHLPDRFWLFVGTLEPRKNLVTLIEAYARLRERPPLIIGGGKGWDYEPIFAAVEKYGLQESVQFVGFIPTEALRLWYNCADVFVYPSVFEGFGLPVLEAMACGTPVIISAASSLPEVAGAAGMTVAPHDVEAWHAALIRARDDSDWHSAARMQGLIEAGRYSWHETARQTLAAYHQALEF